MMKPYLLVASLTVVLLASFSESAEPASLHNRVEQLQREIRDIENRCTPKKGTSRQDVEAIFGYGKPLQKVVSKIPLKEAPPLNSPRRAYELCENGTLVVFYDKDWNVVFANFPDPYSKKGRPLGWSPSDEQLIIELEPRLKQLEAILKAYNNKNEG